MKVPKLGPFQRLLCRLGLHRRDGRQTRVGTRGASGPCVGCGLILRKVEGAWRVDDRARPKSRAPATKSDGS